MMGVTSPSSPVSDSADPDGGPLFSPAAFVGDAPRPHESRNFFLLAVYQIVLRTGWIFKTESVIMPAVMDQLTGQAWMRGCLPMLNRLGQSIPPAMFAHTIQQQALKKWSFAVTTALMALSFGGLTLIFVVPHGNDARWPAYLYLLLYGLFFATLGVNNLVLNTIQGKLIRVTRRGRLLLISNVVGSTTAIAAAFWLLPLWLTENHIDAASVFGFSTALFIASSIMAWALWEQPDHHPRTDHAWSQAFTDAWQVLREDHHFRRFAMVAGLFGTSMSLFPHYQAIGHERLQLDRTHLVTWLIVQNIGTAIFSIPVGPIADRVGNRLVVQLTMFGILATPLVALFLMYQPDWGRVWFSAVFGMVGLTPVVIKTLNNYTLEIAPENREARYLGTLNLCLATPIMASPLVGWMIGRFGFEAAFVAVAVLLFTGWLLSLGLLEPRRRADH
jgi:hypothetical protein